MLYPPCIKINTRYIYITLYTHNSLDAINPKMHPCLPLYLLVQAYTSTRIQCLHTHMHADQAYNKLTSTHIHIRICTTDTHTIRVLYRMYMMKTVPNNNSTERGKMKERNSIRSFFSTQMTVGRRGNTISRKGESIRRL